MRSGTEIQPIWCYIYGGARANLCDGVLLRFLGMRGEGFCFGIGLLREVCGYKVRYHDNVEKVVFVLGACVLDDLPGF